MKKAIIALDGGGSNLRILVADRDTEEELYIKEISSGTNLSTVSDRDGALKNIQDLIIEAYSNIPEGYQLDAIGLSSAGTEILENKLSLEKTLKESVEELKKSSDTLTNNPPKLYVTNDIEILLHSSDMALVAGTGAVCAYKYLDYTPWDNTTEKPNYKIGKLDGAGQHIGDKGAGFWIAKEALIKTYEIDTYGGFMNRKDEFVEEDDSILRELVLEKLAKEEIISQTTFEKAVNTDLQSAGAPEFVSLVYEATQENGNDFTRAKVGNLFSPLVDEAASYLDEAANDILEQASNELLKNIRAAYNKGNFENKEQCKLLLSGSVLVHSEIVRTLLTQKIKENYPNISVELNKEKPVWSTFRYVKGKNEMAKTINSDTELTDR